MYVVSLLICVPLNVNSYTIGRFVFPISWTSSYKHKDGNGCKMDPINEIINQTIDKVYYIIFPYRSFRFIFILLNSIRRHASEIWEFSAVPRTQYESRTTEVRSRDWLTASTTAQRWQKQTLLHISWCTGMWSICLLFTCLTKEHLNLTHISSKYHEN